MKKLNQNVMLAYIRQRLLFIFKSIIFKMEVSFAPLFLKVEKVEKVYKNNNLHY
jgi:hypothetical protein